MNAPTFTVVMPAFNTADTIGSAIRSALGQTRSDFELIVVDDGSTDLTAEAVEALLDDRRIRLLRQENRGAAAARNAAVSVARGRYLSFLDSDDLWLPHYLETMGAALDRAAVKVAYAYTDAWRLDPLTGRIGKATAMADQSPPPKPPATAEQLLLELLDRNFVYNSVTLRRGILEQVGGFEESLEAMIDYEMWLRIAAHGYTSVRPPGLLAVYRRQRPGSISRNYRVVYESLLRVYERVATEMPVSASAREFALERMAVVQAALEELNPPSGPAGIWRRRMRPPLARIKHMAFPPPEEWLATPPPELVAALPDLFARSDSGARSDVVPSEPALDDSKTAPRGRERHDAVR